jgi:hypothetical protein
MISWVDGCCNQGSLQNQGFLVVKLKSSLRPPSVTVAFITWLTVTEYLCPKYGDLSYGAPLECDRS